MTIARAVAVFALTSTAACSPSTRLGAQVTPPTTPGDTVPAGFGSLRRDDIVLRFATDQLQLQILPLDERVIRLLAPDTYNSVEQLVQSRQQEITEAARRAGLANPTLVMVTFYGQAAGARFTPEDIQLQSRGRQYRPDAIVPLSPTWSTLAAGSAAAGGRDLSVRRGDQLVRGPQRELSERAAVPLGPRAAVAPARARPGAGAGAVSADTAESVVTVTRPSSSGVQRTRSSAHTTPTPARAASANARSHPST